MEIFARKPGDKKNWRVLKGKRFEDEEELQKMVYKTPNAFLHPIRNIKFAEGGASPYITAREASGIDILAVDRDGEIYVVETKLYKNREIKREVIGQVIEYAAALWKMDYAEFEEKFKGVVDLAAKMEHLCAEEGSEAESEFDADEFRENVQDNLNDGEFNLAIVVDEVHTVLKKTITYLNENTDFVIVALEVQYFENKELKIQAMVPTIYGEKSRERRTEPDNLNWAKIEKYVTDSGVRDLYELAFRLAKKKFGNPRYSKTTVSFVAEIIVGENTEKHTAFRIEPRPEDSNKDRGLKCSTTDWVTPEYFDIPDFHNWAVKFGAENAKHANVGDYLIFRFKTEEEIREFLTSFEPKRL